MAISLLLLAVVFSDVRRHGGQFLAAMCGILNS
jgi:hypothetical protein